MLKQNRFNKETIANVRQCAGGTAGTRRKTQKRFLKNSPHNVQTNGEGVKGFLNNVKKNCTFLGRRLPFYRTICPCFIFLWEYICAFFGFSFFVFQTYTVYERFHWLIWTIYSGSVTQASLV